MSQLPGMPLGAREMAATLKQRLRERHADHIFATEALAGPGGAQRFDAWAMEPSWVNTRCVGYEVKVRRADFMGDKKWTGYLPFCTELYFVCPAGLIQPTELPPEVGLLWGTANAGKVYQKKVAHPREMSPDALATMLWHVLMWRFERQQGRSGRERAEDRVRDMDEGRELDQTLKKAIHRAAGKLTLDTMAENERLQNSQAPLAGLRAWLEKNGIRWDQSEWSLISDVGEAVKARGDGLTAQIRGLHYELKSLGGRLTSLADEIEPPKADAEPKKKRR